MFAFFSVLFYNKSMNNNKFKFQYTRTVKTLIFLVVILSVLGLVWNIYNFITTPSNSLELVNVIFRYVILAVNLLLLCFMLSIIFFSYYEVNDKGVIVKFGLFTTKYAKDEIVSITLFTKTNKLVTYFSTNEYTVIVIKEEEYGRFCALVKGVNPNVFVDKKSHDENIK